MKFLVDKNITIGLVIFRISEFPSLQLNFLQYIFICQTIFIIVARYNRVFEESIISEFEYYKVTTMLPS